MTDARIYLGRPGGLAAIRSPRGSFEATRQRRTSAFDLGLGGVAVDQMVGGARTYTINYEQLFRDDWTVLQSFLDGHEGPGPFALLDPGQRNMLPSNVAAATSVNNSADGSGAPIGGFTLLGPDDDFNRAPVASGWGTMRTGHVWTTSGGPAANYAASGTRGTMALTTTVTERTASIANVGPDVDVTAYLTPGAVATAAQFEQKIRIRYSGVSSFYETNIQYQTDSTVTLYMVRNVTVLSAMASALTYTAASIIGVRFQATGSTIRQKLWDATSGAPEPVAWSASITDATFAGSATDSLYLVADRITGNTNSTLVVGFDDFSVSPSSYAALSSSAVYTDAGPRSLALTFTSVNTATIAVAWPSSTFTAGIPVVAGRAVCFSCYVRGGGGDPIATYTPRIVWRDSAGAAVSTTSGTPVASASGAFAQMFAQGVPPATTVYADFDVQYTSGASAGTIAYFRRFMVNEGVTPDATWAAGTGVWPVRMVAGPEAWPMLSPELRAGPVVSFVEDVS